MRGEVYDADDHEDRRLVRRSADGRLLIVSPRKSGRRARAPTGWLILHQPAVRAYWRPAAGIWRRRQVRGGQPLRDVGGAVGERLILNRAEREKEREREAAGIMTRFGRKRPALCGARLSADTHVCRVAW